MNPLKWLLNRLPVDSSDSAGVGPFRLPAPRCDWMQRAAKLHDNDFLNSHDGSKRLSEADADLFWRWALEAHAEQDPIERCRKFSDICKYWPLARRFGRYFWDG